MAEPSKGFSDPVFDSQAVFRAAMLAMSRPGSIHELAVNLVPPAPLFPATAALILALCDFETPLWFDPDFAGNSEVVEYVKFHSGAPIAHHPAKAAFAVITGAEDAPGFERFAAGTAEFPDRSTTLLVQVEALRAGSGWRLTGPGVAGVSRLAVDPLSNRFLEALRGNHATYPRGLDIYFIVGHRIAALPRTTVVES